MLRPLGLGELFARMPRRAQELFVQHKFPDPVLEFDRTFPTDAAHRTLRRALEARFREAYIVIDDAQVTVRDFFSVIAGLMHTVRDTLSEPGLPPLPEPCVTFMREAGPLLDYWYEQNITAAWPPLHSAVIVPLVAHSRLDGQLLTATLKQEFTPNGKYVIRMIVSADEPQTRRVTLDGSARPMYRVATMNEWDGVRWLSWEGKGVFVQSHALRQLHERVNLPKMAPYLECWLHDSLRDPVIVERQEGQRGQGEDLLVEYRIRDHRIGYLIVTPLKDVVAVRTFKFLTMENTPEARLLKKHLRLTRRDVDWLRLHELAAFTQTDLSKDPVLRPMLDLCGCGHLFALGEWAEGDYAPEPKPFAAEMRRYLRMAA